MFTVFFGWDGAWFGLVMGALIIGAIAGFMIARALFKKQLRDNPPISEKQIRAMFMQMGRKPSEAQIRAIMKSMNDQNK